MHSVSSWFQAQIEERSSEPVRQFLIGTSDYSDRVTKWPKIKHTANSFAYVKPTIPLDNADGALNHFYENTYKMVQECYLKMGFAGIVWDFLEDDCSDISGWTDHDQGGGVSEVSPAGQFRFDTNNSDATNGHAHRYIGVGSLPALVSVEFKLYHDLIGLESVSDQFLVSLSDSATVLVLAFCSDGAFIYGSGGYQEIGTDLVKSGVAAEWQTWRFVINFTAQTADIYLDDSTHNWEKVATGQAFVTTGDSPANGKLTLEQLGYGTDNMVTHVDYVKIMTGAPLPTQELITLYTGSLKDVRYTNNLCNVYCRDKLYDFSERKVGDSDATVVFSETIPSDIAWTLCTCYGLLCNSKSTGNADIDYADFQTWAGQFSQDSLKMNAFYDGIKLTEALSNLCKMTDSVGWVNGDGKVTFKRFIEADSNDLILTRDENMDIQIDVEGLRIINKAYVYWDYSPASDYWTKTCVSQESISVNSFGLHEEIFSDKTCWHISSLGAMSMAARKTLLLNKPPKRFELDTDLYAMRQELGDTIRLVDSFYSINSESGWRISEKSIDMDTGAVAVQTDEAMTADAFILDVSLLDGMDALL